MLRIAVDAGTSESGVRRFFSQKEDILTEIFLTSWVELNTIISNEIRDDCDPYGSLKKTIRITFDFFLRDTARTKVLLREYVPSGGKKKRLAHEYRKFINKVDGIFASGVNKGVFRKDINWRVFRQAIYGAMEQILYAFYIKHNAGCEKNEALTVLYMLVDSFCIRKQVD
jgi:TetR/AcrR family fatty acid metabolism transcriptional regulator